MQIHEIEGSIYSVEDVLDHIKSSPDTNIKLEDLYHHHEAAFDAVKKDHTLMEMFRTLYSEIAPIYVNVCKRLSIPTECKNPENLHDRLCMDNIFFEAEKDDMEYVIEYLYDMEL